MRDKSIRRALRVAEFSPLISGVLLAVVLFTLPISSTTIFLSEGLNTLGLDPSVRKELVSVYHQAPMIVAADVDGLNLAANDSWPLTALRQSEFFSATSQHALPFSTEATPFAPLSQWERKQKAHVWAWVALPPTNVSIVASATGDATTLLAAEMNAAQSEGGQIVTSDEATIGALVRMAENPSGAPSSTMPAVNPNSIGTGGYGGMGGGDYTLSTFTVAPAGDLWHYYVVSPGNDGYNAPEIKLPTYLETADPTSAGFQRLVSQAARETHYNYIVTGPYRYKALPLRAPAGVSAGTAERLGSMVWPAWTTAASNRGGSDQIRELSPEMASLAGGHWANLVSSGGVDTAYGAGIQPQSVIYFAVWDKAPGGAPTGIQRLWRSWQETVALWFEWIVGGALLLFALSLGAAPVAFVFERRREARTRLAAELEQVRLDAHDKVFNRLSALSKRVALAGGEVRATPSPQLKEVAEDIRGTVAALQEILGSELSHVESTLTSIPLAEQLASVTSAQAARFGFSATFSAGKDVPEVAPRTGWELQCITEEALTNASRHGHAARARVQLTGGEHLLVLTIADEGSGREGGIRIDELPEASTGLRGMRARVQRLGGTLAIDSTPQGTVVSVRLPLDAS